MLDLSPYPPSVVLTVAIVCVVFVGIAKAGFGGGVGVLATPLLSLVVPPLVAAGFLLPLLCACDLVSIPFYRRHFHVTSLRRLIPGALAGIAAGSLFLWLFTGETASAEKGLRIAIGVFAILFVAWQLARERLLSHIKDHPLGPIAGAILGSVAGFASTLAHAGGPPVTAFMLSQGLDRRVFVGTTVIFFTVANYTKLAPYALLGMIDLSNLKLSLFCLPAVPVGVGLGVWLNSRIPQRPFERAILAILFLTGLQLITGLNIINLVADPLAAS